MLFHSKKPDLVDPKEGSLADKVEDARAKHIPIRSDTMNWMQNIHSNGSFREAAQRAGMSTREYAEAIMSGKLKVGGKMKKRANAALNMMRFGGKPKDKIEARFPDKVPA